MPVVSDPVAITDAHLRLADNFARRATNPQGAAGSVIDADDVRAAAYLGLVEAARTYDAHRISYAAYAHLVMHRQVVQMFRDADSATRSQRSLYKRGLHARDELEQSLGRSPTRREIAQHLGCTPDVLENARQASGRTESLDVELEDEATLQLVADDDTAAQALATKPSSATFLHDVIGAAADSLTEREREALLLRYAEGLTQPEAALRMAISVPRVSQLESRGLRRLRTFKEAA